MIFCSQLSFAQKNDKTLTYGSLTDSVYTNSFFGLKVNIPKGWAVQSSEYNEKLKQQGKESFHAEGNKEKAIDQSMNKSAVLLNTSRHEMGSPVDYNANFLALIENIELSPGIKKGSDYLFHAKKLMLEHSKLAYKFEPEFKPVTIGGTEFYLMDTKIENGNAIISQKYYATVINNYALVFVTTNDTRDAAPEFEKLLTSEIKFSK